MFFRSGYNYDRDEASLESGLKCEDESLAQQSFAEECDINTIVRRFGLTGEMPQNLAMPVSGDFTGISDFHSAMNIIRRAEEEFMSVPPEVRARFANDPQRLMSFWTMSPIVMRPCASGWCSPRLLLPLSHPLTRVTIVDPAPSSKP